MPHDHTDKQANHEDSLFKGMIVGAVIGAGILWLFGTDQGKKIKSQIEHEGEDLVKKVTGKTDLPTEALSSVEGAKVDEDFVDEKLMPIVVSAPRMSKPRTSIRKLTTSPTIPKRFFRKSR